MIGKQKGIKKETEELLERTNWTSNVYKQMLKDTLGHNTKKGNLYFPCALL